MPTEPSSREPVDPDQAQALLEWAAAERAKGDQLAAVLEDIAANGLPALEDCTPWEEVRERALARIRGGHDGRHVA